MVSVVAFYSDGPSSNLAEAYKRPGLAHFFKTKYNFVFRFNRPKIISKEFDYHKKIIEIKAPQRTREEKKKILGKYFFAK